MSASGMVQSFIPCPVASLLAGLGADVVDVPVGGVELGAEGDVLNELVAPLAVVDVDDLPGVELEELGVEVGGDDLGGGEGVGGQCLVCGREPGCERCVPAPAGRRGRAESAI